MKDKGGHSMRLVFKWIRNFAYLFWVVISSSVVVAACMLWWIITAPLNLDFDGDDT